MRLFWKVFCLRPPPPWAVHFPTPRSMCDAALMTQLPARIEPAPHTQFTPERQATFLKALADWGNVRAACKAAQVARITAYRQRRASLEFAELWDGALVLARGQVEELLADRALNGVEEKVFYHGEEVATRKRYDSRLLLAHLGRLDKLSWRRSARDAAITFDSRVDQLERGEDEEEYEPFYEGEADAIDEETGDWEALDREMDELAAARGNFSV